MMPIIATGLLEIGGKLIDKLLPNPEAKAAAQLELLKLQQTGELKELEISMSAILAEANSQDKWTSRARPSFMYVFYVLILASIPMGIIYAINPLVASNIAEGFKAWLAAIPDPAWDLFMFGYLGYAGARSFEKAKREL